MARPATGWAGAALVNGLMAIVVLAWLADGLARRPNSGPVAKRPVAEQPRDRPATAPAGVDLPPPPEPVSRQAAPVIDFVPLRAAEAPETKVTRAAEAPETKVTRAAEAVVPTVAVEVDADAVRTGRALLRILEHGEGPVIEIAWPDSTARRDRMRDVLRSCFGMRLALIDRAGGLYLDDGPRGRAWPIDLDRISGFVRRPNGRITSAERRAAARIRRYHRRLPATDPVRLFPRAVDAALLGGLGRLIGDDMRASKTITASYGLRRGRVTVGGIRVDGRIVAGEIDLSRAASPSCRSRGPT